MGVSRTLERQILCDQKYNCNDCGNQLDQYYHIDHVIRRADGGTNDRENLQALCQACHAKKTQREQQQAPVGSVAMAARERIQQNVLKRKIDDMLARDTQQQWGNERIERLLDWIREEDLAPAAFNRNPVWSEKSKREFLHVLLNNQITAPLYIMKFNNTSKMELYDGINRMHTIEQFVKGEIYMKIDNDIVFFKTPPNAAGKELNDQQRKLFLRRDMQVAWWQNIDECEACDMALKLNSGTAANLSERLKWITGIATPRSRVLTRLSKTSEGDYFLELCERTVLFAWLGEIVMRTITDSWDEVGVRVVQYTKMEDFFRQKDVVDEDKIFDECYAFVKRIHCVVKTTVDNNDMKMNVVRLQLLVRMFHENESLYVTERVRQEWVEQSTKKRIYSSHDMCDALFSIRNVIENAEEDDMMDALP